MKIANGLLFTFPFIFATSFASNVDSSDDNIDNSPSGNLTGAEKLERSVADLKKYVNEANQEVLEKILIHVSNPLFYPMLKKLKSLDALKALKEIASNSNKYIIVKGTNENNTFKGFLDTLNGSVNNSITLFNMLDRLKDSTHYNNAYDAFQKDIDILIHTASFPIKMIGSIDWLKNFEKDILEIEGKVDDIFSDMLKAFVLAFKSNTAASDLTSSEKELIDKFLEDCDSENKTKENSKDTDSQGNTKDTDSKGNTKDTDSINNFWIYFAIIVVILILLVASVVYFVLNRKVKNEL